MKQKIISISLCFVLLLSLFIMPLRANAFVAYDPYSAAAAILFGSGLVSDSSEVLADILTDMTVGIRTFFSDTIGEAVADSANGLLMTLPEDVYLWVRAYIFDDPFARSNLKHKDVDLQSDALTLEQIPIVDSGTQLYLPTEQALQNLLSITQEQVLYQGFETSSALESIDQSLIAGNQITFQIQEKLMQLTAYLRSAFSILGQGIDNLTYKIDELRLTTLTQVSTLTAKVEELRLNCKSQIYALTEKVEQLRNNFLEQISSLTAKVEQFRLNVYSLLVQICTNIDSLVKVIQQGLNVTFNPPEHLQIQQQLQLQIQGFVDDFYNDSEEGRKHIVVIIGRAKDILSKYSNAFLAISAVLSKFLNLPILNELVMLSLALGIFALIVNLFSSIVSAHNSAEKAKAKQHSYKRKGG